MARRPLRQLVKEARKQEQSRRPARIEAYDGWLIKGLDGEPDPYTREAIFNLGEAPDELVVEFTFPNMQPNAPQYERVLAEMSLRCVHHCFEQDANKNISRIIFNSEPLSMNVERRAFENADLESVDPIVFANEFGAQLTPPALDITERVQHLADLSAREFESLIINLFEHKGMDVRPIRHDKHGVECLAIDRTPIIGGKVIIHATRDLELVGIPDLRDLEEAVKAKKAVKGVYVTISDYWPGAWEWAEDRPLELITGTQLARAANSAMNTQISRT